MKKALCHKSFKSPGHCTGFVKGNYYDVEKTEVKDQFLVTGSWQNDKRETHRHTRLLDTEICAIHLRSL